MISAGNGTGALTRWFLSGLQTTQKLEAGLGNALLELRRLRDSGPIEGDVGEEIGRVIAALEQAIGRLTVLQRMSREALEGARFESNASQASPGTGETPG